MTQHLQIKLYEAIDTGIQKALILPDENTDDISINFKHKKISNSFIPYEYQTVDLGLSVKWCKYNLGAFPGPAPEDWYGDYYAWGETETKSEYKWDTYKYGQHPFLSKYNGSDGKDILEKLDDAVTFAYGENWRMPTKTEYQELIDNTVHMHVTNYNGIIGLNGYTFAANGNTLFLPEAGICFNAKDVRYTGTYGMLWTNNVYADNYYNKAWYALICSDEIRITMDYRCNGASAHGVCDN